MRKLLKLMAYAMFTLSGVMAYAYVYDVEPLTAEKHYQLERDAYNRSNDAAYNDFPGFSEWVAQQADREGRMHEWFAAVLQQIGEEAAYSFDWTRNVDASEPMSPEQWRIQFGD